jgi:hypothetical protein
MLLMFSQPIRKTIRHEVQGNVMFKERLQSYKHQRESEFAVAIAAMSVHMCASSDLNHQVVEAGDAVAGQ